MDQKRYIDFKDMFDGGGAGKMGDTFQGGGLFSLIANMIADPYGSKDPERRKERMKALGLLDTGMDMSTPPAAPVVEPVVQPKPLTYGPQNGRGGNRGVSPEERLMQMPVTPMSAEDRLMQQSLMANPLYAQSAAVNPFGGAGAQFMSQVRGATNRQPAGTPTSMYEPNPEDMMRQKMRNAGYDPTGLGAHEMQLFIDAMGL